MFTDKHECVMQFLLICGHLYWKTSKASEARTCFYHASRIGQSVLKNQNSVTLSCTKAVLEITETESFTAHTELVTMMEEMLQYAIASYKQKHGRSNEIAMKYTRMLAELYVAIKETQKAKLV